MRARDYFGLIGGVALLLFEPSVNGAEWRVIPMLRLGETYTDNITLAPSGSGTEQDEFITQITPGFSLRGRGGRLQLGVNYLMQNLLFAKESGRDRTFHRLLGIARAELFKDHLFFNLRTVAFQTLISPTGVVPPFGGGFGLGGGGGFGGGGFGGGGFGGGGFGGGGFGGGGFGGGAGNLFATDNISTVVTLQASPSYCWRWGNTASGQLRYRRQEILLAPEGVPRTSADRISGSIRSGSRFDRLRWAFVTNQRYLHREDMPGVRFTNYFFRLQLRLFQRMSAFGIFGYEDNSFRRGIGNRRTSGTMWNVGLSYRPSRRTLLQGGVGQRFFGTTAFARASYGTKRNRFGATYSQQFFTFDQLLFAQSGFNEGPVIGLPEVTEETFLSTRTMLFWSHKMTEKTRFLVRGFQIQREFQERAQEGRMKGGSAFWIWRFAPRTNVLLGGLWMRRSFAESLDGSRTDDLWNASLTVRHRFDRKLNLALRYAHGQRDSTNFDSDFGLNMVTAMIFMRF